MSNDAKDKIIEDAILYYTIDYINFIKNEINQFFKYNLERFNNSSNLLCTSKISESKNTCIKNAVYLNKTNNEYLCWYHGFILCKTK